MPFRRYVGHVEILAVEKIAIRFFEMPRLSTSPKPNSSCATSPRALDATRRFQPHAYLHSLR